MKRLSTFLVRTFVVASLSNLFTQADANNCAQCRGNISPSIHGNTGKWLNESVPHRGSGSVSA